MLDDVNERELSSYHLTQLGATLWPSRVTEGPLRHALSFDIEDWFHIIGIDAVADSSVWPTLPSLVVDFVYLHPRDFAPEFPRVSMPIVRRFEYNVGLGSTEAKLKMLLNNYAFDTCAAVLGLQPDIGQA
jgi:hypothetical protein